MIREPLREPPLTGSAFPHVTTASWDLGKRTSLVPANYTARWEPWATMPVLCSPHLRTCSYYLRVHLPTSGPNQVASGPHPLRAAAGPSGGPVPQANLHAPALGVLTTAGTAATLLHVLGWSNSASSESWPSYSAVPGLMRHM